MSCPYRDFVQGVQDVERRGFLRRRLVCDVPGPREEQESPSSLVGALRADLRKTAVGCQKRTRAGPKAGIGLFVWDQECRRSLRILLR